MQSLQKQKLNYKVKHNKSQEADIKKIFSRNKFVNKTNKKIQMDFQFDQTVFEYFLCTYNHYLM